MGCQTDLTKDLEKEAQKLRAELDMMRKHSQELSEIMSLIATNTLSPLSLEELKENLQMLNFFTGIPEWTIL